MADILDNDFKTIVLKMIKELKESVSQESDYEQSENISIQLDTPPKN